MATLKWMKIGNLKKQYKRRRFYRSGSTILCGIEIGENAIIGAGSVVTNNVILFYNCVLIQPEKNEHRFNWNRILGNIS